MYKKAWNKIENSDNILLLSHVRPDGDTLGCVLALYLALKALGKKVYIFNPSSLPRRLAFLPNAKKIKNALPDAKIDLSISCDCGSLDRLGVEKKGFWINLDHHDSNENFGDINIVEADFASATMVVYELFKQNNVRITKEVAECLYVGFAEDTGFFSYGNLDHHALNMVLELTKCGLNMSKIAQSLKQNVPLSLVRLKGFVYEHFELLEDASISFVCIKQDELKHIGCTISDTKNIANLLLDLASVKMVVFMCELEDGRLKISLRSKDESDMSILASHFGGGGHKRAAGFETEQKDARKVLENIIQHYRTEYEKKTRVI